MQDLTTVYVLGTSCLILLLVSGILLFLVIRTKNQSLAVTMELLMTQQQENQSLRNQVRSMDPMTLAHLNGATGLSPYSYDDDKESELVEGQIPSEFAAAGWAAPGIGNESGTP